jgi:hypothetical protein
MLWDDSAMCEKLSHIGLADIIKLSQLINAMCMLPLLRYEARRCDDGSLHVQTAEIAGLAPRPPHKGLAITAF